MSCKLYFAVLNVLGVFYFLKYLIVDKYLIECKSCSGFDKRQECKKEEHVCQVLEKGLIKRLE
jgi:hypothetical protein